MIQFPITNIIAKLEDRQAGLWMLDHVKLVASTCENLFLKNNWRSEFTFEEKDFFKISENKNLLKITSYTVVILKYNYMHNV